MSSFSEASLFFLETFVFLREIANLPDLGWASPQGPSTPAPLGTGSKVCLHREDNDDLTVVEIHSSSHGRPH